MKKEQIQVGCYTIIGDRKSQQDTMQYAWKGDYTVLAVVCDGMGGMSGGERASRKAVDVIFKNFAESFVTDEAQYSEWLKRSFVEADEAVAGLTDEAGNILHSGSTVVGVLIKNNRMYWASAGDSVIYYLDTQGIHTVTRMHNYNLRLEQLLNSGKITVEEAKKESMNGRGEALISFLGIGGLPLVDSGSQTILMNQGDIVILASDGLYKSLTAVQIQAIVEESGRNMSIAAERLCKEAQRLGECKQDNTTVIAVRYSLGSGNN